MALELSDRAKRDLREILDYSEASFGTQRAIRYGETLNERMRLIAANPSLGKLYPWHADDIWRISCGRHFIYYRPVADGVRVIRILHQRMSQDMHLG